MTEEKKAECVLRLFGVPDAAVKEAAGGFSPQWKAEARWKSRGAETLVALSAQNPAGLKKAAQALLQWGLTAISGLKDGQTPCFLDKIGASLTVWLAFAHLQNGENDAARAALKRARSLASAFDAAPDFRAGSLRFIRDDEQAGVYDDLGETALGGVEKTLRDLESPALSAMWREENEHE